jgi:hypothetical protein
MALLLIGHGANLVADWVLAEHGKMARVNARRAIFAGMINAYHSLDHLLGRWIAREAVVARAL